MQARSAGTTPEFEPRRVFEHLDKLAYEIGPRLAGTRGEELAARYVKDQFESYGLETSSHTFKFVDRRAKAKVTACSLATAFVLTLILPPPCSLAVWFASLAFWRSLGFLMPKRWSQNIVAKLKGRIKRRILITAHMDSAPCITNENLHFFLKLAFLPLLTIITLALIAGQLGFFHWPVMWMPLAMIFLPTCYGMFIAASGKRVSPGANDNASGVAVMLEIARIVAQAPPSNVELWFAALGAEEQGLVGSRELAKKTKDVWILNLDMLGVGKHAFIVEGSGLVRRHKTPPALNEVLKKACERAGVKPKPWWAALAGHDHVSFLRAKLPATTFTLDVLPRRDRLGSFLGSLFGLPNARVRGYRYIHTFEDIPERIELENIERAGRVIIEFIKNA